MDRKMTATIKGNSVGPGKKRSFGDMDVRRVNAELPVDLVHNFLVLVARKNSRLNTELAAAMKLYLSKNHASLGSKAKGAGSES